MTLNGKDVDVGLLGPTAQEQIAKAMDASPRTITVEVADAPINLPLIYTTEQESEASAEKSFANRLNEICNSAVGVCSIKSNWSSALTDHEAIRIDKHVQTMRFSIKDH